MAVQALAPVQKRFDAKPHIRRMREDGYTIIEDFLDTGQLAAFRAGIEPLLGHYRGRNPFEGRATERVYTMVARGEVFEDLTCDPRLMAVIGAFLRPNFLLSASHAICIFPGEVAQSLHTDDSFYLVPRPRPALGISVIGAIDAFTAENGGTVVLPGSHLWSAEQGQAYRDRLRSGVPPPDSVPLEMPPGAVAVFPGTIIHGAGANRSKAPRLAFTSQYCEPWLRTRGELLPVGSARAGEGHVAPTAEPARLFDHPALPGHGDPASHPAKTLDEGWTPPVSRQAID